MLASLEKRSHGTAPLRHRTITDMAVHHGTRPVDLRGLTKGSRFRPIPTAEGMMIWLAVTVKAEHPGARQPLCGAKRPTSTDPSGCQSQAQLVLRAREGRDVPKEIIATKNITESS